MFTGNNGVSLGPPGTLGNLRPWQRGQSGNPQGRPRRPPAIFRWLDGERTTAILENLYSMAIDPTCKSTVKAAELLLAYRYGRPPATVEFENSASTRTTAELVSVVLRAALSAAALIRKGGLISLATATPATLATSEAARERTVATVAVAGPPDPAPAAPLTEIDARQERARAAWSTTRTRLGTATHETWPAGGYATLKRIRPERADALRLAEEGAEAAHRAFLAGGDWEAASAARTRWEALVYAAAEVLGRACHDCGRETPVTFVDVETLARFCGRCRSTGSEGAL